jgi:hypothetical protein
MDHQADHDLVSSGVSPPPVAQRPPPGAGLWWTVAFPATLVLATHIVAHVWGGVAFDAQRFWLPGALGLWGAALAAREVRLQTRLARIRAERDRLRAALIGRGAAPGRDRHGPPTAAWTVVPSPPVARAAPTDATANICDRVLTGLEHDAPPPGRATNAHAPGVGPRRATPVRHARAATGPGAVR